MNKNTERDAVIRMLYRKGTGGVLGKYYGVSRQRVNQIVHNAPEKHHNQFLGVFMDEVRKCIGRIRKWVN
jgi:hypothetical protein